MSPAPWLTFENWRTRIQTTVREDELLLVVAAYLGTWRPRDVNRLSIVLTSPIETIDELHCRAVELAHAEVTFKGSNADWAFLRELALVITAAASRARYLEVLVH